MVGSGTELSPYLVTSQADLIEIYNTEAMLDKYFKVTTPFEINQKISIGDRGPAYTPFSGTFDGDMVPITINITNTDSFTGIFDWANGATIKNVYIRSGTATFATGPDSGIIVHTCEYTTIQDCTVACNINNCEAFGYISTYAGDSTISNCTVSGTITTSNSTGTTDIGGICGLLYGSITSGTTIDSCSASLSIVSTQPYPEGIGGIVGAIYDVCTVTNCNYVGYIEALTNGGGIVGYHAGYNGSTVSKCWSHGAINVGSFGGGICSVVGGAVSGNAVVSDCYSIMNISQSDFNDMYVGGISGYCYYATITNCYSSCTLSGDVNTTVNGITGQTNNGGDPVVVTSSYYNSDKFSGGIAYTGVTAKTAAELAVQETFTGWSFGTSWYIASAVNNGMPVLRSMPEGNGTADDKFIISNYSDFLAMCWLTVGADNHYFTGDLYFEQLVDLDFSETSQLRYGHLNGGSSIYDIYNIYYEGNNKKITNVEADQDYNSITLGEEVAVFPARHNFNISNLTIEDCTIKGTNDCGVLIPWVYGDFAITNCHTKNCSITIYSTDFPYGFGGFASWFEGNPVGSTVSRCSSRGITINGTMDTFRVESCGGFVGYIAGVVVSDCYSRATINISNAVVKGTAEPEIGGFAGGIYEDSTFERCYAASTVNTTYNGSTVYNGSFCPWKRGTVGVNVFVTNCFYDSELAGTTIDYGTDKTTASMKVEGTFTGFSFNDVWYINPFYNNGYPTLDYNPYTIKTTLDDDEIDTGIDIIRTPFTRKVQGYLRSGGYIITNHIQIISVDNSVEAVISDDDTFENVIPDVDQIILRDDVADVEVTFDVVEPTRGIVTNRKYGIGRLTPSFSFVP